MIFGDGAPHVADDPNGPRREAWSQLSESQIGL
jgi:hypothetical protein